ncbi:MAG TPA: TolC family protein [Terriglobales bacterium]|nr:TolC family protein [Terriglobales bacterium]
MQAGRVLPIALLGITLVCSGQEPAGAANDVLTLEQAVSQAVESNRSLRIADLEVAKAGDRLSAARTRRLPSLDVYLIGSQLLQPVSFQFPAGAFGDFPATGPIPSEDAKITTPRRLSATILTRVTQPLSQLYQIGLGIHQRRLAQDVDQEKLRAERQNVVNQVKRAYYAALETQSGLDAAEQSVRHLRELDRLMGDYVVQQVALKSEGLDAKARLAQAEYRELALRNALASQKEQLNLLLGRDIRTEFEMSPAAEPGYLETDLPASQQRALARRPEIRQARLQVEQAEYDRRIKKAEYIPDLSLAFNYVSFTSLDVLPRNLTTLGLQLSWEPFDWGRRKNELAEKSKALDQAQTSLREAEARVLVDVNHQFRRLAEARALLRAAQIAQDADREKLRVVTNRYGQQAALLQEVLQAESAVAQASHEYQQAVASFWTAKADFEKAVGED